MLFAALLGGVTLHSCRLDSGASCDMTFNAAPADKAARWAWMARTRSKQTASHEDHSRCSCEQWHGYACARKSSNPIKPTTATDSRLSFRLDRARVRGPCPETSELNSWHYTKPISGASFGNPCGQRRKSTTSPQARARTQETWQPTSRSQQD